MKKVNLYKFTHLLLLKNDAQLKQKSDKQPKKKSPKFIFKKSFLIKQKKKKKKHTHTHTHKAPRPGNQNKIFFKKKEAMFTPKKP